MYVAAAADSQSMFTAAPLLSPDTLFQKTPVTRLPRSAQHWYCSSSFPRAGFSRASHAAQVRQLIADNKFEEAAAMLPQGTAQYIREVNAVCAVTFELPVQRRFEFERLSIEQNKLYCRGQAL